MKSAAIIGVLCLLCSNALAQIDTLFGKWDRLDTPGLAVAVVEKGQVVHKRGYGQASLEHGIPITSQSVFDIASVSKQFAAFAIAQLVEEEKVSLDDDIRKYIPEMPDLGEVITVRHLVHHTSGLRDWPGVLAMAGRSMEDVISMEEIFAMARHQTSLNFPPGQQYSYSNTGYNLLAILVERVSGMSFRKYTDRHIFRPLGMLHTWFLDNHEELVPERAYGYQPGQSNYRRVGNGLMALGSSSLHTTIDDLIRWVQNFSTRQVGADAVHAMMEDRGVLTSGDSIAYAFGQVISAYRGLRTISHTGSWGGFRTILLRFPDQELSIILLSNTTEVYSQGLAFQIADSYLGELMEAAPMPPSTPPPVAFSPGEYAGFYDVSTALIIELRKAEDKLLAVLPAAPPSELHPVGVDSFFVQTWNSLVTFKRDSAGSVTHMTGLGQYVLRQHPPEPATLRFYAGGYYSMELGVSYTIQLKGGSLVAVGPRGDEIMLTAAAKDIFTTDRWYMPVIRFFRDDAGGITHFEASNGRSLRVEFRR